MTGGGAVLSSACDENHAGVENVLWSALFLFITWAAGQATGRMGLPPLAGEIVSGMVLGPQLANLVPEPNALKLFGEFGLYLMVIEAGLEIEVRTLKQVGGRALGASIVGMLLGAGPLAFGIAKGLGLETKESLAVAASLAPCSTGVALVVLKRKRALNTPIGQLIVATAFAEDIIALILLSELRALARPDVLSLIRPVGVSLAYAVAVGAAALFLVPFLLSRFIIPVVPARHLELAVLLLLLALAGCLMAGLNAGGASPLLGAFLAGLSFCTIRSLEHVWKAQVKRLQTWLVRIFFACTVGFDVPVRRFGSPLVWRHAAIFWVATLGKLSAGVFGVPRKAPQMLTLGLAMASLGEFSFIVGATARNELQLMSDDTYAAVTLAVLFTIVLSPAALSQVQDWVQRRAEADLKRAVADAEGPAGRIYYKLDIKVLNRWGLVADILRLLSERNVEVIEFRVDLRGDFALYEAYLKDTELCAPRPGVVAFPELSARLMELRGGLMGVLAHDPRAETTGGDAQSLNADGEVGASVQTVNFAALRGLRLERWMPGSGPEEWDEAGAVGNEQQATVIMRREVERSGPRSVMDIFGLPEPPAQDEKPSSIGTRKDDRSGDTEGEPDIAKIELTATRPASVDASSRLAGVQAAALQNRGSADGGSRRGSVDSGGPCRGSRDGGPRRSMSGAGAIDAAAVAAWAAHLAQHRAASPMRVDLRDDHDHYGGVAEPEGAHSPLSGLGDSALHEAESVDRAIAAALERLSVAKHADEDAHGLLGLVRHQRARGLDAPGAGPSAVVRIPTTTVPSAEEETEEGPAEGEGEDERSCSEREQEGAIRPPGE